MGRRSVGGRGCGFNASRLSQELSGGAGGGKAPSIDRLIVRRDGDQPAPQEAVHIGRLVLGNPFQDLFTFLRQRGEILGVTMESYRSNPGVPYFIRASEALKVSRDADLSLGRVSTMYELASLARTHDDRNAHGTMSNALENVGPVAPRVRSIANRNAVRVYGSLPLAGMSSERALVHEMAAFVTGDYSGDAVSSSTIQIHLANVLTEYSPSVEACKTIEGVIAPLMPGAVSLGEVHAYPVDMPKA